MGIAYDVAHRRQASPHPNRETMMPTMKESSKKEWTSADSIEHINTGSLQRIADACEKMAIRHTELIDRADKYERFYKRVVAQLDASERRNAALRGVITKLRRRAAG